MGCEHNVRLGAANAIRQQVDEARLVMPALDEGKLGAATERGFQLLPVARD